MLAENSRVSSPELDLEKYFEALHRIEDVIECGHVTRVVGLTIESLGPAASIGDICRIYPRSGGSPVLAEVVGFRDHHLMLMPIGDMNGIGPGSMVRSSRQSLSVPVGDSLLGRVLDGLGRPIDGKGPVSAGKRYPISNLPPHPLERKRITEPLTVGVRSIDGVLTCGKGQRIGIFAGSGVGKSTLLGMMARNTSADVNVIGLIGERGREVREFLDTDLGEQGLKRSVVVVATSDQPALVRLKGAFVATAIAEYFRDTGRDVLFMMDSVTRFAAAQREVGLAVGEPPATRGYTPSVFAMLPRLLERTGAGSSGTITGIYTVLVEGDDFNEPISDAVRGILDGHIILSRELAEKGHYPSVDVLASVSRVMQQIVSREHADLASKLRKTLATYREAEDLINIGAYVNGSNPRIDYAIQKIDAINAFLEQRADESSNLDDALNGMKLIFEQ